MDERAAYQRRILEQSVKAQTLKECPWQTFLKKMIPLESEGTMQDRFRQVARKWRALSDSEKAAAIAEENKIVM